MSSILAILKSIYEHKEKIILGILILVFVGVGYVQFKNRGSIDSSGADGERTPEQIVREGWKPAPPRKPESFGVPRLSAQYSLETYTDLVAKDIWTPPEVKRPGSEPREEKWASIRVKSIFDPTQSGSYIAIIEVDKRSRIVREGQQFEGYEVRRIDAVRNCLTISRRGSEEEKEFCKEE